MSKDYYISLDGTPAEFDINAVVSVVRGVSSKREGWRAMIIYIPSGHVFVELRDSPPDVRGNSREEAEQVEEAYLKSNFGLDEEALRHLKR